jgi:hypothetical protein
VDVSQVFIRGIGAVSPAGWGMAALREALARGEPIPPRDLARPGCERPLRVRQVPAPVSKPAFIGHARLRRTSPIAQYTVAAALEAMGSDDTRKAAAGGRLGIVLCAMSGCVNYSRRFYDETLKDPATASPLVFPETVYNAPASHLAALLGAQAINYTVVGDPGTFLQGVALAADWLINGTADGCLVIGSEEMDWLTADAARLFERDAIVSEGAGALYLTRDKNAGPAIQLRAVSNSHLFTARQTESQAAKLARADLPHADDCLLCDSDGGLARVTRIGRATWHDWAGPRLSPKHILGEGFMAGAAWQCVAAIDALDRNACSAANVSVVGCNQQAIAAQFIRGAHSIVKRTWI